MLRHAIYEHLKSHGEITYPEALAYAKQFKHRPITALRFLQSDAKAGRHWQWRVYAQDGTLLKNGRAWFLKKLKKPIKESTVFKKV